MSKKMEILFKKEIVNGFKIFRSNPYARIEAFLKERKLKNRKKELHMKLAVLTGGIKKMK